MLRAARQAAPPLAFQPETHRAGGCGVATRTSVPDQRDRVDTRHQIERVEKLFRASGRIVTVEQIRDGARERRHPDLHPQPIDRRHAVGLGRGRPGGPLRGLHEPAGQAVRLVHARLSRGDDLHVVPLRTGVAVQLQGRVIGDHAARAQPRGRQEAVNGPVARVRVLGHGREHTAVSPCKARARYIPVWSAEPHERESPKAHHGFSCRQNREEDPLVPRVEGR